MFDELLLLKKGGQVVFHGELGENCSHLIAYFESLGAPKIETGDNPANWMLRVLAMEEMGDLAEGYLESDDYAHLKEELDGIADSTPDPEGKIEYDSAYANSSSRRQTLVTNRLRRIYWRSPAYNLARISVSAIIAFVLGSVFITNRNQPEFTETEMRSRLSVIFLTFIIVGIMAILEVLPVMTKIRDMYYRHSDSNMYGSTALAYALGSAEWPFIVIATVVFVVIFLAVSGMDNEKSPISGLIGFSVSSTLTVGSVVSTLNLPRFCFPGFLLFQPCHLFLLWAGFCMFGQTCTDSDHSMQRFYRHQQLFRRSHCSTPINARNILCFSLLHLPGSLRIRGPRGLSV